MDHGHIAGLMRARRNENCGGFLDSRNNPNHTGLLMARSNGRHIGRSVYSESVAVRNQPSYSRNHGWTTRGGVYSGVSDPRLARDVWAAQVAQWWLSNGNGFASYGMSGKRSEWGGTSGLPLSGGNVPEDLRPFLPRIPSRDQLFLKGPDGILGPAGISLIANYLRSRGKVAANEDGTGTPIPVPNGPYKAAFDRLVLGISSPEIENARENRDGSTGGVAQTPCNELNPSARAARADCAASGGGDDGGGDDGGGSNYLGDDGDVNWLLVGGVGALVLGLGIGGALYLKKRKSASQGARREIASPESVGD